MKSYIKRAFAGAAIAAILVGGGLGPAFSADHGASTTGSKAWNKSSTVYNRDTAADGDWTRTNWTSTSGTGGFNNTSGSGAEVKKPTGKTITGVQACRSRNALPMVCSAFNNDY